MLYFYTNDYKHYRDRRFAVVNNEMDSSKATALLESPALFAGCLNNPYNDKGDRTFSSNTYAYSERDFLKALDILYKSKQVYNEHGNPEYEDGESVVYANTPAITSKTLNVFTQMRGDSITPQGVLTLSTGANHATALKQYLTASYCHDKDPFYFYGAFTMHAPLAIATSESLERAGVTTRHFLDTLACYTESSHYYNDDSLFQVKLD